MKKYFNNKAISAISAAAITGAIIFTGSEIQFLEASSHREAPYVANDPLTDNTDLYAFRSPDDPGKVTIIANYIPFELPQGGPNYYSFGENIRYEIHIKNKAATTTDDITYRFTFKKTNEDPSTFFNIRLGKENLKTTYTLEKSTDGGANFTTVFTDGIVPPYNIGPRSIEDPTVGLGTTYSELRKAAIKTQATGETFFCGSSDDPFFADLGGIFDLANIRPNSAVDGLANYNTHSIAIQVPIELLQKDGKRADQATNILDGNFVIGVWASASRPSLKTLNGDGTVTETGNYVQVSRLGMPLTNEVIIPIGKKDRWNTLTPYNEGNQFEQYFVNPELALYMDTTQFALAVPGLAKLRIQTKSLGTYDFRNGKNGLFPLKGNPALDGTALADAAFGNYLLRDKQPRSVDLLPIFNTGVPDLPPYQLAIGKNGNPLAPGKPFVNNFLPVFGDMLRLNMAVPVTDRSSADFSSLGLVQAAVLGLTDSRFNKNTNLGFIPNMDGFPNGRRLEDDVVRIELQAVSGVALAAIGLWYDDFIPGTSTSPVTPDLLNVLTFTTGVEKNDTTFAAKFPYVQTPWQGFSQGTGKPAVVAAITPADNSGTLGYGAGEVFTAGNYPNPFRETTSIKYRVTADSRITINVYDAFGRQVGTIVNSNHSPGTYEVPWNAGGLPSGTYFASVSANDKVIKTFKMVIAE